MLKKRNIHAACIVLLGALTPATFGAVVSFKEHPIAIVSATPGALSVKANYWTNSDHERATSQRFAAHMGGQLRSYAGASITIIESTATFAIHERLPGNPNWEQVLRSHTDTGISCTLSMEAGFLAVSYEKEPGRLLKASLAKGVVPPLALVAENGAQALAVWATASGMSIHYDEVAIARETTLAATDIKNARKSLILYSGPDELETEILRGRPMLVMKGGESIAEMMGQLAALSGCIAKQDGEVWTIAPPDASEANPVITKLLAQLSNEEFDHIHGSAASALVKIGEPAAPALLTRLNAQTCEADPYIYHTIAAILARIPSAERDEAFLRELERNFAESAPQFLEQSFSVTMVESLAEAMYLPALPLLQKLAMKTPPDDIVSAARVGLAMLGVPPTPAPVKSLLVIDQTVADKIQKTNQSEAFEILTAVVDTGFQPFGAPLELTKLTVEKEKTTFGGKLRNGKGGWNVTLIKDDSGYGIIARYNCGSLCAGGEIGRAEYRNNRWLIVEWKKAWVS